MSNWFNNLRLRWKILFAPALLILVLVGLGSYALHTLRANQASVDGLMSGPVHQNEVVAEFTTAAWTAHARLYRLAATAANESDEKKVKTVAFVFLRNEHANQAALFVRTITEDTGSRGSATIGLSPNAYSARFGKPSPSGSASLAAESESLVEPK